MQTYGADILGIADELTDAYVEVFTAPPWDHRDPEQTRTAFRKRLDSDALRDGFRAWIERSEDGRIAGFVSGWTTPAPFRRDRAYGSVLDRLGPEQVRELLIGAFEIDELGVAERARGTGLGRRLLLAGHRGTPARLAADLEPGPRHDRLLPPHRLEGTRNPRPRTRHHRLPGPQPPRHRLTPPPPTTQAPPNPSAPNQPGGLTPPRLPPPRPPPTFLDHHPIAPPRRPQPLRPNHPSTSRLQPLRPEPPSTTPPEPRLNHSA